MVSLKREKTPTGFCYRLRWREGGRGSKEHSRRFDDKRTATDELDALNARLNAARDLRGRALIPWSEVRTRWLVTIEGDYRDGSKSTLEIHTKGWGNTLSATPAAMGALPIGTNKVARACLNWAWLHLKQPVDARALKTQGARIKPKRAEQPLLTDGRVAELMNGADDTGAGNGAVVHLIATYGHRPENLVRLTSANFPGGRILFRVKGGHEVTHPLLQATSDRIDELKKLRPSGPLFLSHMGKPWKSGRQFSSWFQHTFHVGNKQLKRAAISRWFARGLDAKTIASITGHRSVALLANVYAATNEHRQAAALATLRDHDPFPCVRVCPVDIPEMGSKLKR